MAPESTLAGAPVADAGSRTVDVHVAQLRAKLGPDAQQQLRDAIRAAYLAGDDDGPRSWATRAFAVAGRVPG